MPVFDITAPDGTKYEVTGPEGSTEHDALAQVMAQHQPAQKSAPQPSMWDKAKSLAGGIEQGLYDIPQSAIELGARGTDAVGLTDGAYPALHNEFKQDSAFADPSLPTGGDPASRVGRIGGQIAGTLPAAALKVPGLAANLPRLAPILNGAVQGATSAALTSSSSDAPLGKQLALGAGAGAALPVLAKAVGSVISPAINPAVKALMDRGIPLTPGQMMGGAFKAAEDKLSSVPIIGDMIRNGQRNSVAGLNKAAYSDALAPIGQKLPSHVQPGREGVDFVQKQISDRYDSILPQMSGALDPQLIQDVTGIAQKLKADGVTDATIDRFKNVVDGQLAQRANGGAFASDTLKGIQSDLGRLSAHHGSSADSNDRALGSAIGDVQSAFNDMLLRQNPQFAQPLQEANQAWAQYARIRRAASSVGSKDGVFSPAQYANAVKASDKSVGKGAYARGKALQQDLSDPANQVLPNTVPDSGTPGRLMMAGLGLGGLPVLNLPAGAAAGLTAAMYTKPGQKLAALALARRPAGAPALSAAINKYGILGAPALGSLIANSGQ